MNLTNVQSFTRKLQAALEKFYSKVCSSAYFPGTAVCSKTPDETIETVGYGSYFGLLPFHVEMLVEIYISESTCGSLETRNEFLLRSK